VFAVLLALVAPALARPAPVPVIPGMKLAVQKFKEKHSNPGVFDLLNEVCFASTESQKLGRPSRKGCSKASKSRISLPLLSE